MRRFFVKNLLFVLTVNILVKPLWIFMIDRTVQNRVGHSMYGTYQAVFNLGIIFQIVLDFGINNFNTRLISQSPGKLKKLFPVMLTAKLVFIFLYAIIVGIVAWLWGYKGWELTLLGGTMAIQALSSMLLFIRSNVAALHKFRIDGILSVTDRLLMIAVCGVLLFHPYFAQRFHIEWFVYAQIACYGMAVIIALFVLRRLSGIQFRLSPDVKRVSAIIRQSAPYALLIFLMSVYTRSDTILLERLSENGKIQAGIYVAGYRLLDVGNMVGLMFAGVLLPLFGRMLMQKQDVNPIVLLSANIMLPVAFIISVGCGFFSSEIMHMLYKNTGAGDDRIFAVLMAAFPGFCIMYIYSTLLTANGNLRLLNKIAVLGVIINLSLNIILIPHYKAMGAAVTTFITQTVLASCFIIFSKKELDLNKNIRLVASYAAFILLLMLAGYVAKLLAISWLLQFGCFIAAGAIMVFIFRFVSLRSVKLLLESR
jgi:O-antigen/teichoic acid export membrane protein